MPLFTNRAMGVALLIVLFIWAVNSSAAPALVTASIPDTSIDWFQLGMGLFGGLALFLAGLDMLSDGLKKAAGETLKLLLSKLTTNRFMGAITGSVVTGVLNSSSVTTVLVVSFITAGTMTLSQSVGVIMGANIGSTVTAQLLAFNLSAYALLPIAIGFFMTFTGKQENIKHYGMMLMGIGLVFFGMGIMSDAMTPLRSYEPFIEFLKSMESPLIGLLAGAIFTGLVQSSAATVGIAIAMASEGLLSLPAGIALALGANIGTCVTVMLAALGKPVEAVRAAIVHVLFNVLGAALWIFFIPQLAEMAISLSPEVADGATQASQIPRQIANANTLFNIINTILFIGFTGWFAKLATRLAPTPPENTHIIIEAKYLYEDSLESPTLALEQVRMELGRMGGIIASMLRDIQPAVMNQDRQQIKEIISMDVKVNILESLIFQFLSKIRKEKLTEKESHDHQALMSTVVNLKNISDVIKDDMAEIALSFIENNHPAQTSEVTRELFRNFYHDVCESVEAAIKAITENDQQAAERVIMKKEDMKRYVDQILRRKSSRLGKDEKDYLKMARQEITLMQDMHHLYFFANRVAEVVIPQEAAHSTIGNS